MHYVAHRYDQAVAQFRKILEIDPGFEPAKIYLGKTYECLGQHQKAIAEPYFDSLRQEPRFVELL